MMEKCRRASLFCALMAVVSLATLATHGCRSDDGNPGDSDGIVRPQPDTIPPAAATDLRLRAPTHRSLALVWTAPGDDGIAGTATRYDIRLSDSLITDENWDGATPVDSSSVPTPRPFGNIETIVVLGLDSSTRYYFALKTVDEVGNESGISNCATEQTLGETFPPSNVTDLAATTIDETSFELTWTAPGDDYMSGTAAQYEIRYSIRQITDEASWDYATPLDGPPSPKPAGEQESFTVTGLTASNYFFALKAADDLDNWSGLSNQAHALGWGEVFFVTPGAISTGEYMFIVFRASPTDYTRVSLHRWVGDKYCGVAVIDDILWETLPDGVYMIAYDFFDDDTQTYIPPSYYVLSLCWGTTMMTWRPAILDE